MFYSVYSYFFLFKHVLSSFIHWKFLHPKKSQKQNENLIPQLWSLNTISHLEKWQTLELQREKHKISQGHSGPKKAKKPWKTNTILSKEQKSNTKVLQIVQRWSNLNFIKNNKCKWLEESLLIYKHRESNEKKEGKTRERKKRNKRNPSCLSYWLSLEWSLELTHHTER